MLLPGRPCSDGCIRTHIVVMPFVIRCVVGCSVDVTACYYSIGVDLGVSSSALQ